MSFYIINICFYVNLTFGKSSDIIGTIILRCITNQILKLSFGAETIIYIFIYILFIFLNNDKIPSK